MLLLLLPTKTQTPTHFFFSSRSRPTRWHCDWSSDVCSSDLAVALLRPATQGSRPALEELADEIAQIRQLGLVPEAEAGLRDAEEVVLQIDARIPTSSIRRMPLPDAEQTARYAGLLAHHAEGSLARMDRVDML